MKLTDLQSELADQRMAELMLFRWVSIGAVLSVAVLVAFWIGNDQTAWLFIAAAATVCALVIAGLRQHAWVLILIGWAFVGKTQALAIPLSIRDMTVLLATGACIGYQVLSKRRLTQTFGLLDGLIILNVMYVATIYLRHPVGLQMFGSQMVGGRFYFNVFIALLAYWVITRLPESPKLVSRIPYFILAGAAIISLLHTIAYIFPSMTAPIFFMYSALDLEVYFGKLTGEENLIRLKGLSDFGLPLVILVCAYYPPRTLLSPFRGRFYALLLGLGCLMAAGFRGTFFRALVALGLGSWLHRGLRDIVPVAVLGALMFGALLVGQGRVYELPMAAQRTLSFLPAKWSVYAKEHAESSSQWRFELWQRIIREGLIKDWWFGDGFGIAQRDYMTMGKMGRLDEDVLLTGAYHNGPLSTIRFAGIAGLVLIYTLMIAAAIYSYRCVEQCRGTILLPVAIYLAIQLIWEPFHFTFIFGGYDNIIPQWIFNVAVLQLVIRMSAEERGRLVAEGPAISRPAMPVAAKLHT